MKRKLVGFDLNGWSDRAFKSWRRLPGEDDEVEGAFELSGGVGGVTVRMEGGPREVALIGGVQALLAPQGRGGGWGDVGRADRRVAGLAAVSDPAGHTEELAATMAALGAGADFSIAAIDDTDALDDATREAWLKAFRKGGIRGELVWRPVLAAIYAIEQGLLDEAENVLVVSHHTNGLVSQKLRIRGTNPRAPERRQTGRLHRCALGYGPISDIATERYLDRLDGNWHPEEIAQLSVGVRTALGLDVPDQLIRAWNGGWLQAPGASAPPTLPDRLPDDLAHELSQADFVLLETLASGELRQALRRLVAGATKAPCPDLPPGAVASGALTAGQRMSQGLPAYYDFLPSIATIVWGADGPANFELIPSDEVLPAGRPYRSLHPAQLGLRAGQEMVELYIRKQTHARARRAEVEMPGPIAEKSQVSLFVEQKPAAGSARLTLESRAFGAPISVDWDQAEDDPRPWADIIDSLQTPLPSVPQRLVIPSTLALWDDTLGDGLSSLLRLNANLRQPDWETLKAFLNRKHNRAQPISSDGELPPGVPDPAIEDLTDLCARAEEHVLARARGDVRENDNSSLSFLTWTFRRCPEVISNELLFALKAGRGAHPFYYHPSSLVLICQGLGRTLDGSKAAEVFETLLHPPIGTWQSRTEIACLAFLLSRTDGAPLHLDRDQVETIADLAIRVLQDVFQRNTPNNLRYPPFLFAGLLRWRLKEPRSLVTGTDPVADAMNKALESIQRPMASLVRQHPHLARFAQVLHDVKLELAGESSNSNLLLDLATA